MRNLNLQLNKILKRNSPVLSLISKQQEGYFWVYVRKAIFHRKLQFKWINSKIYSQNSSGYSQACFRDDCVNSSNHTLSETLLSELQKLQEHPQKTPIGEDPKQP